MGQTYTSKSAGFGQGALGPLGPITRTIKADLPPSSIKAQSGGRIKASTLGQAVPIVIGTGRVDGSFVLGGTRIISTTEYHIETVTETTTPTDPVQDFLHALGQGGGVAAASSGRQQYTISNGSGLDLGPVITVKEIVVPETTTKTVAVVGYVLAFDALKTGYNLISLEVDGKVVYDGENGIGESYPIRFYGGRQTTVDAVTEEMVGDNAGAYQNYVMVFLEGFPADNPPSVSAVISNAATDQAEDAIIQWLGAPPDRINDSTIGNKLAYDPTRGFMYQLFAQVEVDELSRVVLVAIDVNAEREIYRVDLEDTEAYASLTSTLWINPLRGTDYVMVRLGNGVDEILDRIYDVTTGRLVAEYAQTGDQNIRWLISTRLGTGKYVFVGHDFQTDLSGDEKQPYLTFDPSTSALSVGHVTEDSDEVCGRLCQGRSANGSVSFFGARSAGGGSIEIVELTYNGVTFTQRVVGTYLVFELDGLWYDSSLNQLILSRNMTIAGDDRNVLHVNPVNGTALAELEVDQPYRIFDQVLGRGQEKVFNRPGCVLFITNDGAGGDSDRIVRYKIAERIFQDFSEDGIVANDLLYMIQDDRQLFYITGYNQTNYTIHYLPNTVPGLVDLDLIITQVMSLAGFGALDLRFEGFSGLSSYGFTISSDTTFQTILQQIAEVYGYSFCDTGNGFYFRKAQQGDSFAVDVELGPGTIVDGGDGSSVNGSDQSDFATPIMTWFEYVSKENNYRSRPASFVMPTGVSSSIRRVRLSSPIVMSDVSAQQFVTQKHFDLQVNRRSHSVIAAPELINYLPGDIISIPYESLTYIAQIEEMAIDLRNMAVEISSKDFQTAVETTIEAVSNSEGVMITFKNATLYVHLDLPLLNYSHDLGGAGLLQYGFLSGRGQPDWPGGMAMRGSDPNTLSPIFDMPPHFEVVGIATTVLPDMPNAFAGDFTNSLTFQMIHGRAESLEDATESEVLEGVNMCFVGVPGRWEVMGFMTVVDNEDNTFTISDLAVRGSRGTEVYAAVHERGDYVVIAPAAMPRRATHALTDLGDTFWYKPLGLTQNPSFGSPSPFVISGAAEKPYAPINLDAIESAGDILLSWDYRNRLDDLAGLLTVPTNGEATLKFTVEIIENDSPQAVLRTINDIATNSLTYTAAQIAADFGSVPPSLTFRVYMISAAVGRGHRAQATITL